MREGRTEDGGCWAAVFTDENGNECDGPDGAARALVTELDAEGNWIRESVEGPPWREDGEVR